VFFVFSALIALIAILISPILITNVLNRQAILLSLRATGGIGYASDAILNFAEDSLHDSRSKTVFFRAAMPS